MWMYVGNNDKLPHKLYGEYYTVTKEYMCDVAQKVEISASTKVGSANFNETLFNSYASVFSEQSEFGDDPKVRRNILGLCFCHSVLICRLNSGYYGNKIVCPITLSQLRSAASYVVDESGSDEKLTDLLASIYCENFKSPSEQTYVTDLFDDVMKQVSRDELVVIGDTCVLLPPDGLPSNELISWLETSLSDDCFDEVIGEDALKRFMKNRSEYLIDLFGRLGEETLIMSEELNKDACRDDSLQWAIDTCNEKFPPFLNVDENHVIKNYSFVYHAPSEISVDSHAKLEGKVPHLPESIGFVLHQECTAYNELMRKCRNSINKISSSKANQSEAANMLRNNFVPKEWLGSQNKMTLLNEWLTEINHKYLQRQKWINQGMVPTNNHNPVGVLQQLDLGSLFNPAAMIIALCQEKAVLHEVHIDQITIRGHISNGANDHPDYEAGICVENCYLNNAEWNHAEDLLETNTSAVDHEINLYLYPFYKQEDDRQNINVVNVPLFVNKTKNNLICYVELPMLKSKQNVSYLRGIPIATNAYLTLKQLCDVTVENNQSETVSDDWQLMRNVDSRIRFSLAVQSAKNLNDLEEKSLEKVVSKENLEDNLLDSESEQSESEINRSSNLVEQEAQSADEAGDDGEAETKPVEDESEPTMELNAAVKEEGAENARST